MSWRDRIAKAVIANMREAGYPRRPDVVPQGHYDPAVPVAQQYEIDAIQRAESMFNDARGNRMQAAEQALQQMQTPHRVPRENIRREGTLGVLQSDEPLTLYPDWNQPATFNQRWGPR
jgi:hypothetical protein